MGCCLGIINGLVILAAIGAGWFGAVHIAFSIIAIAAAVGLIHFLVADVADDLCQNEGSLEAIRNRRTWHLRASAVERRSTIAFLGIHLREGRLNQSEYHARRCKAVDAVYREDLALLITDLPRYTDQQRAQKRRGGGYRMHEHDDGG